MAAQKKHIFCEKPVDLTLERARACAEAVAKAGCRLHDRFSAPLRPDFRGAERANRGGRNRHPEMLIVTSRDPGAPPVEYIKHSGGIFKDMLIQDFDIFRWILDDEAEKLHATGSCLRIRRLPSGRHRSTAVTIRTKRGRLRQINTAGARRTATTSASKCSAATGMLQAGNLRPTEVVAYSKTRYPATCPKHLSSNATGPPTRGNRSLLRSRREGQAGAYDGGRWPQGAGTCRCRDAFVARRTPGAARGRRLDDDGHETVGESRCGWSRATG